MNYAESSNLIHGSISGIHVKQDHHDIIINERLHARQFTGSTPLQPNYGFSSTSTRQNMFPILETRQPVKEPRADYQGYSVKTDTNSITRCAPPHTYLANVDVETSLQNRVFALGRSSGSVYVPHSSSDLYKVEVEGGQWPSQPHELLFSSHELSTRENPIARKIGGDQFFNHTRTQLRGL